MIERLGRRPLGFVLAAFVVVVVAGALVSAFRASGPPQVREVPATLPAGGVEVGGQIVLKPLAPRPARMVSKAAAIEAARRHTRKPDLPATALAASVSVPGSKTIRNLAAWVVTFTAPRPRLSVVVDAVTGNDVVGFFTK